MPKVDAGGSDNTGHAALPGGNTLLLSPSEAGFRKDQGIDGLQCGECVFYENGTCRKVDVTPDYDDVCDQFEPMPAGRLSAGSPGVGTRIERSSDVPDIAQATANLEFLITRVAQDKKSGKKKWYARASGVERDLYQERMSVELFEDFIERADRNDEVPSPFSSKAWHGGLPYIGVAHYLDLDGYGIVGPTEALWIDGSMLKARGSFDEKNPLALASYDAIKRDIEQEVAPDKRVRISIAFLDWLHDHEGHGTFERKSLADQCPMCRDGTGDKLYRKGQLVHLALTRRPAYPPSEIQLEERSMPTSARKDDAASIVGGELADELERRAGGLQERSVASGVMVIKDESDNNGAQVEGEPDFEAEGDAIPVDPVLGGALTLKEAENFLESSVEKGVSLIDPWDVFGGVLANIAPEKAAELQTASRDMQTRVDIMAVRALTKIANDGFTLRAGAPPWLKKKEGAEDDEAAEGQSTGTADTQEGQQTEGEAEQQPSEDGEEDQGMASGTAEARVEGEVTVTEGEKPTFKSANHALDEALLALRTAFDEAVDTPVDATARLQMIQPEFIELGEAIKARMAEASKPPDEPTSAGSGLTEDRVAEIVARVVAPLLAEHEARKASQADRARVERRAPASPARRAITAAPLVKRADAVLVGASAAPESEQSGTPKLRKIVERSVGMRRYE